MKRLDAAWNLNWRTNPVDGTWQYEVDGKNQLTNVTVIGPLDYDGNGNLTNRSDNVAQSYEYDDENRLSAAQVYYLDENGVPQG